MKLISTSNLSPPSNDLIAGWAAIGGMLESVNGSWSADSIATIRFSRVLSLENNCIFSLDKGYLMVGVQGCLYQLFDNKERTCHGFERNGLSRVIKLKLQKRSAGLFYQARNQPVLSRHTLNPDCVWLRGIHLFTQF